MRFWPFLLLLLAQALAQSAELLPLGPETQGATRQEILAGRGSWSFPVALRYDTSGLSSGTYEVLLELVPAGPPGVSLTAYLTPGLLERLSGSGSLGALQVSGRTSWGSGFRPLLRGIGAGVVGRLELVLDLEAQAPGPLPPGYLFLQATVLIRAQ